MTMKMKAKSGGGVYEQPEAGDHAAVLVAIIELGTVEKEYKGQKYNANELYFCWELVEQQMTGSANNHVIGRSYSRSLDQKANLRQMITKWRGRPLVDGEGFDLSVLLGMNCILDIQTTADGKYCRLDPVCVSRLRKGEACAKPKRTPFIWELAEGSLEELPDWLPYLFGEEIAERISRSDEWTARTRRPRRQNAKQENRLATSPTISNEPIAGTSSPEKKSGFTTTDESEPEDIPF